MPATARPTHSHSHAGGPAGAKPKLYNPRHPERTLLYQTIAEHFETWHQLASCGQFDGQGDHHTPKPFVRQAFRKYLECGIFAHGFARAWCDDCGHDYFVAYSCKGRGVCPSCNTRRMVETAAHPTDHVFPRLPVRQWVLSVPKRLRYFMQRDGAVLGMVLRIFLRVIAQSLQDHSPGAASVDKATLQIGAVAFIHRFGSSLNGHVHFHVCVVDGVFEEVAGQGDAEAKEMLGYQHSGFPVDAGVCIEADDRAALVPPPRTHRHRYFGVLAPNSPHRAAVTALAQPPTRQTEPANITEGTQISKILDHIGVDSEPPQISPARGPPLWDDCSDAQTDDGVHIEPDWDLAAQPAPDYEVDQRSNW